MKKPGARHSATVTDFQSPFTDHRSRITALPDPHDHPARVVFKCLLVIFVVCGLARILLPEDPPSLRDVDIEPTARRCIMHYTTQYRSGQRPVPVRYHTCQDQYADGSRFQAEGN